MPIQKPTKKLNHRQNKEAVEPQPIKMISDNVDSLVFMLREVVIYTNNLNITVKLSYGCTGQ